MKKKTVLLIDDEKIIRDTGAAMIEMMGYNCITASSGKDGIEMFKKLHKSIFLVLLDVEMPDLKGNEVCEILKKEFSDVNILFTSGYGKRYLEEKIFCKRIENFIPKPLSVKDLAIKFEQFME